MDRSNTEQQLFKRKVSDKIIKFMETDDILVLHGARQVGKTHILYWLKDYLQKQGHNPYYMDLEDSRLVKILDAGVTEFITHLKEEGFWSGNTGKVYVFIDEIQYLANPSEFLKLIADHHKNIKLVVSGSSSFAIKSKFKDSLVGRTINFEIFNLSFEEFLIFNGYHFNPHEAVTEKKTAELKTFYSAYVLYGGYPKVVLAPEIELKEKYLQQIIDTYVKRDIRDLARVRDVDKFNKLVETLAAQSGQLLNVVELSNACKISMPTVEKYLFILENTYVIKLVRPFFTNMRSELFKMPKIFFYDSGLAQMLWLKRLQKEIIGSAFETSVFGELVKKYGGENVFYWRTKMMQEIDFVLKTTAGMIPIEAKVNFESFKIGSIRYFMEKYKNQKYVVAGLKGERSQAEYLYPWEL